MAAKPGPAADDGSPEQYLAMVGKARALLNLDRPADAAAVAAAVPDDFVFEIDNSDNTARQENGVFQYVNLQERWTAGLACHSGVQAIPASTSSSIRTTASASMA